MKIGEAWEKYSTQLDNLWTKKRELQKEQQESVDAGSEVDESVIVELSDVEEKYEKTRKFMSDLLELKTGLHNVEVAKQQGKAWASAADDVMKCMEIARRIARGDKVPSKDEFKLIEYSLEMYEVAKNIALMKEQEKHKEYDSLWDDEQEEQKSGDDSSIDDAIDNRPLHLKTPQIQETAEAPQVAETPQAAATPVSEGSEG